MLFPVRCTCGKELGSFVEAFKLERAELLKETLKDHPETILPHMLSILYQIQTVLGPSLDKMNIVRECCRQKMITSVEIHEYLPA